MKQLVQRPLAWSLIALILGSTLSALAALPRFGQGLPKADLDFLRDMTRDVVEASRVKPGSNGGGRWPLSNSCGFTLVTPGKDTYTAFWVRDSSMSLDSGSIAVEEMRNHLLLISARPNGQAKQDGVYMTSVALPYGILKRF